MPSPTFTGINWDDTAKIIGSILAGLLTVYGSVSGAIAKLSLSRFNPKRKTILRSNIKADLELMEMLAKQNMDCSVIESSIERSVRELTIKKLPEDENIRTWILTKIKENLARFIIALVIFGGAIAVGILTYKAQHTFTFGLGLSIFFVFAGLIMIINIFHETRSFNSNERLVALLTKHINEIPDIAIYDSLTSRIRNDAILNGLEPRLKTILKKNGLLEKK